MARVIFPVSEMVQQARQLQGRLEEDRRSLLNILGVQLLSLEKQNFEKKSRGGTGDEGVRWKPLKQATIEKKGRSGRPNERRKTTLSGKRRPTVGSSQIGVDTGLMRNSSSPGFRGTKQVGKETRQSANLFDIRASEVTVGYNSNYAKHFDAQRPLMPERVPRQWQETLDRRAQEWADRITKEVFGAG